MTPAARPDAPTAAMFSAVSRRKQILIAAVCSSVSGGDSRLFTLPARGAFAITVSAHSLARTSSRSPGIRIGYEIVEAGIELHHAPVCALLILHQAAHLRASFFTDSVLIPTIVPKINRSPRLRTDQF